ncbi:MAG: AGE family epimerase/isomerase [Candidatus Hodarchaeota archaeon]
MAYKDVISRYERELTGSVIPFWEKHCIDTKHGGFFTFLDRDGSVYDTDKYMWMQWRIVYMFATLAQTRYAGEKNEKWMEIAKKGYDFLTKHGKDEKGSYYFALNQEGKPIVAPYNIASEFFVIMGSAALYEATKEEKYKESAIFSMKNVLGRANNPKGKWNKRLRDDKKRLDHGIFMATANLGTILKTSLGIDTFDEQVKDSVDMILDSFWNEKYGVVFENLNVDKSIDLESCTGRHLIPGHGLESMWFILEHSEVYNRPEIVQKTCKIINSLLEFSWDNNFGGIYYFMDVLGKPHVELQWDMKLWWVHNEALIATIHAYRLSKESRFLDWFKKIDEWTWKHFPDKEHGEWYGYLNRRGEPTHLLKGGKWKTFFHLPRCLLKCIENLENL